MGGVYTGEESGDDGGVGWGGVDGEIFRTIENMYDEWVV